MSITNVSSSSGAAQSGTSGTKKSKDLDKNAFLKILAAELSNQDPTNASSGTEFVAQMAQFSSLEQMQNLNSTMKFSSMSGLVGKKVVLDSTDADGNLYNGVVKDVSRDGDSVNLDVAVGTEKDKEGNLVDTIKEFSSDDVYGIIDNTTQDDDKLLSASHLIGSTVVLSDKDEKNNAYQGVVKAISKDAEGIKVTVLYDTTNNKTKDFTLDKIVNVK